MPLPWKKTRGNRISRIVADLQPPTRPGSLVVETGFPASLVDLFVKNRERIKRQSSKKKKTIQKQFDPYISDSVAPPPTPVMIPDNSSVPIAYEPREETVNSNFCQHGETLADLEPDSGRVGRGLFVVAMKVFLVMVLALSSTKLAVGITLSAFLLLLLEFFGKFGNGFLKPCGMSSWIRKILGRVLRKTEKKLERQREWRERDHDPVCEIIHGEEESNFRCDEIQILEAEFLENQNVGEEFERGFLSRENRWGCLDGEEGKFQVVKNQRRSKSAKLKAKIIKKLIPKKLRSKKMKEKKEYECEWPGISCRNDRKPVEEHENEEETISSIEEEEEEEEKDGVSSVNESWHSAELDMEMGEVEKGEEERKNWECIFVVVMILSGLLGGRFLAIILAVSSCFLFKFIKILNQNSEKNLGEG